MPGKAHDLRDGDIEFLVRLMRMRADGEEDVGVTLGDVAIGLEIADPGRDRHQRSDARCPRAGNDPVALLIAAPVVEMAMVIDQHQAPSPFDLPPLPCFGGLAAAAGSAGRT
jgi:hypothetical protein